MSVEPKVVVVTGASGGVGRGIALACAEAGWHVWIAARRDVEGRAVAAEVTQRGGTGWFVTCDVADRRSLSDAIAAVLAEHGRLDGVVHNATSGLSPRPVELGDVPVEDLLDHAAVALRPLHALALCAFEALRARRGSLLVTTSEAGFSGSPNLPPYAGVKGAQRGLLRALAREWGPHGVRVNGLAPLAMTPALQRAIEHDPALEARVTGRNPMRRVGDATDDIGRAARFLLSDEARYVTGHTLTVDGGACPAT